jgi:predicted ATPase
MTETSINTLDPETQVIVSGQTIKSLKKLIAKRDIWLDKPENKRRSTFIAVLNDTKDMREKLKDLQERLEDVTLKIK